MEPWAGLEPATCGLGITARNQRGDLDTKTTAFVVSTPILTRGFEPSHFFTAWRLLWSLFSYAAPTQSITICRQADEWPLIRRIFSRTAATSCGLASIARQLAC